MSFLRGSFWLFVLLALMGYWQPIASLVFLVVVVGFLARAFLAPTNPGRRSR